MTRQAPVIAKNKQPLPRVDSGLEEVVPERRRKANSSGLIGMIPAKWRPLAVALLLIVILVAVVYERLSPQAQPLPAPSSPPPPTAQTSPSALPPGIEIYFNDPKYPDDAKTHSGGLDSHLVSLIGTAQRTIDLADYDFDLKSVVDALVEAKRQGVVVRMITDTDTINNTKDEAIKNAFERLKAAGIPIVDDNRSAIMHDKFTVVDNQDVSTGSWNYTDGDTYRLNNWMGVFRSPELAANYTAEFEQLFAGKFGAAKTQIIPNPTVRVGGATIQTCFSPKGKCGSFIEKKITADAKSSIRFLAFSFTHDGIGKAMLDRAANGVSVAGVFETTGSQTQYSEYAPMKAAGLDVLADGNPYVMHHKVIVIDERWVFAGSFNFSSGAEDENDENLLLIDDKATARLFLDEYDRVRARALVASKATPTPARK